MVDDEAEVEGEIVDGLPVVAETTVLEERSLASVPAVQAAALAATGFVAGACTVAVVRRTRSRRALKKGKRKSGALGEIVSSNSFLIDVHLLRRD